MHMRIRKNDTVLVIAGRERGKSGKVLRVIPEKERVVIEHLNMVKRHSKGRGGQNQAAKKFKLSVLTVSSWLKAAGVKGPGRKSLAKKAGKAAGKATKSAKKAANKAKRGALNELEALKAAIRKLIN